MIPILPGIFYVVQFRDASNIAHAVKNFRVRFRDLRENYLHPNAAKMYMHAVVDRLCEQEALQTASAPKSDQQNGTSLQNADYSDIQVLNYLTDCLFSSYQLWSFFGSEEF